MRVLHFNLCLVGCQLLGKSLAFLLLPVHLSLEILDISIKLSTLVSQFLDFGLKFANQGVQLFNFAVFIGKLALQRPVVFGLFLSCMLFKTGFQIIDLLEGVSDFDLVLVIEKVSDAAKFLCELLLQLGLNLTGRMSLLLDS